MASTLVARLALVLAFFLVRVPVAVRVLVAVAVAAVATVGAGGSVNFTFSLGTISAPQHVRGSSDFLVRGMMVSFLH